MLDFHQSGTDRLIYLKSIDLIQFENYVQKWTGVDFCLTAYADGTLSDIDTTSNAIGQWADTFDVWVLAFKYALGLA